MRVCYSYCCWSLVLFAFLFSSYGNGNADPLVSEDVDFIPETVVIPGGKFFSGSNREERDYAYRLDEKAYGHSVTRDNQWYESENNRRIATTTGYRITRTAITNRQYAAFVQDAGLPAPDVNEQTWSSYALIHPFSRTRRHAWADGSPPTGRLDHPVVLVSHDDAQQYARWLSEKTGQNWRLPDEVEWEKAVRGITGNIFPWGNRFEQSRLNSHDQGYFDTEPVGNYPDGASPYGLLDGAGQVFEWTATEPSPRKVIVKGGSWDDKGCGVCRPAARHTRPAGLKHIIIGFRLVKAVSIP